MNMFKEELSKHEFKSREELKTTIYNVSDKILRKNLLEKIDDMKNSRRSQGMKLFEEKRRR